MQKLYFSISEISGLVQEEQHILRYWEKEFEQLKPKKNRGGNRTYSQKDLFIVRTIKKLIRDEKLSLKGAKEHLTRILKEGDESGAEEAKTPISAKAEPEILTANSHIPSSDAIAAQKKVIDELLNELKDIASFIRSS